MSVSAKQWRAAAEVLRRHAEEMDRAAEGMERATGEEAVTLDGEEVAKLRSLLSRIDGHFGLAIHRSEGSRPQWLEEAGDYRIAISQALRLLG